MRNPVETNGFVPRPGRNLGRQRRAAAIAELVAGIALAIGIVVATIVTAGVAHADSAPIAHAGTDGGSVAVALVLGLMLIGMGGLTMLSLSGRQPRQPRH